MVYLMFTSKVEAARHKHLQLVRTCAFAESVSLDHLQCQLAQWIKPVPSRAARLEHGQAAQAKAVPSAAHATHMAVVKHGSAAGMPAAATKPIAPGSELLARAHRCNKFDCYAIVAQLHIRMMPILVYSPCPCRDNHHESSSLHEW